MDDPVQAPTHGREAMELYTPILALATRDQQAKRDQNVFTIS